MQFAKINGINLHYQLIGAPEGKPVIVFSNSLGTDFRIWRDVIVRMVGEAAIITYDKRGHGLSDCPKSPYAMDDHVDDLAGLVDLLNVKDAVICGLSVGGLIAQGLIQSRPDLVSKLILCDTGHKIGNDEVWNTRIEAVKVGGMDAITEGTLGRWFTPAFCDPKNPDLAGYRNMLSRTPAEGYIGTAFAIRDTDYTSAASAIQVPTLCVVGEEDAATPPKLVKELAHLIPNAFFESIQGAGHLPCIEKPEVFAEIIKAFLEK